MTDDEKTNLTKQTKAPLPSNAVSYLLAGVRMLADVCEMVDSGADMTGALKEQFDFALLQHRDGVDRAIDFVEATKGFIERCKLVIARVETEQERAENVLDQFKQLTKEALTENDGLPFKGFRGQIALQKNSQASLKLAFSEKHLTPDMIKAFGIPDRYVKIDIVRSIDTEAVRADLEAGEEITWAALEQGFHCRFRK